MFLIDLVNDYNRGFHLNCVFNFYVKFEYFTNIPVSNLQYVFKRKEKKTKQTSLSVGDWCKNVLFSSECVKSHDLR